MMRVLLNEDQSKAVAGFLFDIAKGLVLGAIGFTTVAPIKTKISIMLLSIPLAFWCIKTAIFFLEE